jgi:hypothetical protein
LTYDAISAEEPKFLLFDIYDMGPRRFLSHDQLAEISRQTGLGVVPTLFRGPYIQDLLALRNGPTTLGGKHTREGIVIRADPERKDFAVGRVCLKVVGEDYHLRKENEE